METILNMLNPSLVVAILIGLLCLRLWFKNLSATQDLHYQREVIQHQEGTIRVLAEELRNAKIKQKHSEVAQSLSDDVLRERMQHEGYYRD